MDLVPNFLELFEKLSYYKDDPLILNFIAFLLLFSFVRSLNHPRYKYRILASLLIVLVCLNLYVFSFLSISNKKALCIIIVSLTIIIATIFYSIKYPIGISALLFKKIKKLNEYGDPLEVERLLKSTKPFLFTTAEKLEYAYACQRLYFKLKEFNKSYKTFKDINQNKLLKKESERIIIFMAQDLFLMGGLKKAEHTLESVDFDNVSKLNLLGMIYEQYGDLSAAAGYWYKAKLHIENADISEKSQIYCNYGRIRLIEHNYTDALFYYRKAYDCLEMVLSNNLRHIVYQNIIHTLYKKDPEDAEIDKYCNEYYNLKFQNEEDFIEYYNFTINFALQQNAIDDSLLECVAKGYEDIVSQLDGRLRYNFEVSALSMAFDFGIRINVIMNDIRNDFNKYFKVKMPDRFGLIKNLYCALKDTTDIYCGVYNDILAQCKNYLSKNAPNDLNEYYNSLEEYEVNARCNALRDKIFCTKETQPYNFDFLLLEIKDITDIYELEGLYLAVTEYCLNIADECIDKNNLDINARTVEHPEIISEYVNRAITSIGQLKNHPSVSVFNLRIAVYLLAIDERERSKEFLEKFNKNDINLLPNWLRRYYFVISQELST